jgi:cell volume regulation protein A
MRRALGLLAAAIALLLASNPAGAATAVPIPGTPVQVVELGPSSVVVAFGAEANFSWGVFNGGPQRYDITVTTNASEPGLRVETFPSNLSLPRGSLQQVRVNMTAPANGNSRTVFLRVTFATVAPVASSLQMNATLAVRAEPATLDVLTAFIAIGGIIAIGFAASLIFDRTRIPDLLILIFLGILLGPIALLYFGVAVVPAAVLEVATPYFAAVALMIILFDGGLNLSLRHIVPRLGIVGLHTGVAFVLTVFAVAVIAATVLGYPLLVGLLLGAILGGTSSAVVIGIVRALPVSDETKVILTLESVLTDVLCVVSVLALIELLRGGPGASVTIVFTELAARFGIGLLTGGLFGVAWIVVLQRVEKKPFAYMLTIAILFILYGITEIAHGSGAMASFVFGLVLGNHVDIAKRLGMKSRFVVDQRIKQFHSELSFVVRTFFFVLLGLVFTFQFGGSWSVSTNLPALRDFNGTFILFLLGVFFIFVAIVAVRLLTAGITGRLRSKPRVERRVLWSLMGRGLAAAVLSSLPFTVSAFVNPVSANDAYYRSVLAPLEVQFFNIVLYIILLTVATTTIGVAASARSLGIARPKPVSATESPIGFWAQWDADIQSLDDPPNSGD